MNDNQLIKNDSYGEPEGMLQQAKTSPLGTGEFETESAADPLASAQAEKKSHTGTLLILAVVIIAGGGLFFMRTLAHVTAAVANDMSIERFVDEFLKSAEKSPDGSVAGSEDAVIEVLNQSYKDQQVALEDVQHNPFLVHANTPARAVTTSVDDTVRVFEEKKAERRKQIEFAAKSLTVGSVMTGGSRPLANIGGKLVRVGESVMYTPTNVEFEVTAIVGEIVSLVARDERYDLSIETSLKVKHD